MPMKGRQFLFATSLISLVWGVPAAADGLMPHRAVYDLSLHERTERSGISGISGRMVYEFDGSVCEGYTVNFRFVTRFDTEDFSRLLDEQSTTYEAPDGESFDFATRSYTDSQLDREARGTARPDGKGIHVAVERPEQTQYDLGQALFPTQHLVELLGKARDGHSFYETRIFDGSEAGSKIMTTTVVLGRKTQLSQDDPEYEIIESAGDSGYWPVDIAYFALENGEGEEMPTYRISFRLHEGGISHDIVMDYGDFAIAGQLVELSLLDRAGDCE